MDALTLCNACDLETMHDGCNAGYCRGCCPAHGDTPTEVARLPQGVASHLVKAAEAVDHAEANLDAARTQGPGVWQDTHDAYADAVHTLSDAVLEEANQIEEELEHGYRLTQTPPPAGAARVAAALYAYRDDLETRRGL